MLKGVKILNTAISIQLMPLCAPKYWILWKHQQLGGEQSGRGVCRTLSEFLGGDPRADRERTWGNGF